MVARIAQTTAHPPGAALGDQRIIQTVVRCDYRDLWAQGVAEAVQKARAAGPS
jgi:hypothetical protein